MQGAGFPMAVRWVGVGGGRGEGGGRGGGGWAGGVGGG